CPRGRGRRGPYCRRGWCSGRSACPGCRCRRPRWRRCPCTIIIRARFTLSVLGSAGGGARPSPGEGRAPLATSRRWVPDPPSNQVAQGCIELGEQRVQVLAVSAPLVTVAGRLVVVRVLFARRDRVP